MRIKKITPQVLTWELDGGFRNPIMTWTHKTVVLVFVVCDDGTVGVGECWASGAEPSALVATLEDDVSPRLIGKDPLAIGANWSEIDGLSQISARQGILRAALAGIDIALWDILGKAAGLPVWRLLGGFSDRVFPYASAGLYAPGKTPADQGAEMAGYVAKGFTGVKMKVGGASFDEDVARVAAVRDAVGPDVRLMVDALGIMTPTQALRFANAVAPHDVYWFEQPVAPEDIRGLAAVNQRGPIPVSANENAVDRGHFRTLITEDAARFIQFDVLVVGGITEGRRIANLAEAWHLPVTLHHAASAVCMAANLHLAAGLPNCDSIEYHMLHQWLFDRVPDSDWALSDGHIRLGDKPGLGLDITPDSL
ncbi:MAG: mandelate racemase/muconate lactonizing enzyme family protein [Rhodospirillales bacterium]|nr:mandelate racemase/muconate lactonizing enzyme family protein [Rhodospirillales bacterium]